MTMLPEHDESTAGDMLRRWRRQRRYSQLALALEVEVSQRHLSFVESGRARPSREMIQRLTAFLDVPLRARNAIFVAAGFAPAYGEVDLAAPEMAPVRQAIDQILQGIMPHPAFAVDRHWTILTANRAVSVLTEGVAPALLEGKMNALRLALHPDGLAPRIINFREWRAHILARLAHDVDCSASPELTALLEELRAYPVPSTARHVRPPPATSAIAIPLQIESAQGLLSLVGATTVFGTATDITLTEIFIESFFPADAKTAAAMVRLTTGN